MITEKEVAVPKKNYVYFANLDGVRAIASLLVVVCHIELHKADYNLQRLGINVLNFGKVGVTIFFALSGFLITYLLLVEKDNYKKVAFKAFYMRRLLRIWPLYFLLVIIGFFVYPAQGSATALWLSVFFLPNLAFTLKMLPSIFDPIWSIGTEEQFYIFHPHIFRIKKVGGILTAFILITIAWIALGVIVRKVGHGNEVLTTIGNLLYYARFDNMMIGAIVAVLYFNTKNPSFNFKFQRVFNLMFNKYVQGLLLVAFVGFITIYMRKEVPKGDVVIALLAALLIVNLCETSTSIYSLNNSKVKYIGKISYGIYLLHKFPLFLVLYLVKTYMADSGLIAQNIVIYVATIVAVIALSSASYWGFERYFLRIKSRFQKITQQKVVAKA